MKKVLVGLAALVGVLLLVGVLVFFLTPKDKLMAWLAPEIDNIRVTDTRINQETATMNLLVDVKPSLVSSFVDSITYDFRLYGTSVAQGKKVFHPDSSGNGPQTMKIPVSMNHNKTRELVRRQVKEGEKVQARIAAYSDVPLFGPQKFDMDEKIDMVIPALPGAEVTHLKIEDFGLDEMQMVMTMQIDNPNAFDYTIKDMKMHMEFPDKMISEGGITKPYLIKARSVTPVQVHSVADTKKPVKTVVKTLLGDHDWPYTMKTYMVLEPNSKVVGTIHMDAVKTGSIDVVEQVKKLKEVKKAEKKAEKAAEKKTEESR